MLRFPVEEVKRWFSTNGTNTDFLFFCPASWHPHGLRGSGKSACPLLRRHSQPDIPVRVLACQLTTIAEQRTSFRPLSQQRPVSWV